jgi:hypothetical protein
MELWRRIKASIYGPAFYRELVGKPLSYSFKYYVALAVTLALAVTVVLSAYFIPAVNSFLHSVASGVLKYYPQELVVTVKDHHVSTNVPEPYAIKLPDELRQPTENGAAALPPDTQNLLVIDTTAPFTVEAFKNNKTVVLVAKDTVAYLDHDAIKVQPLDRAPDATITKQLVASYVNKFEPLIKFVAPLIVILVFLICMFLFAFELLYLVFGALLVWLVAAMKKLRVSYGKAYQFGLHALTLPFVVSALFTMFGPQLKVPFLTTALLIVVALVNLPRGSMMPPAVPPAAPIPSK